jgi:hypothetical protein
MQQEPNKPGLRGRWPDEQAPWSFWTQLRPATVVERARHEAGHAVVAHVLGVECERVACDRIAADVADVIPRLIQRGQWTATNRPYSHKEQILISLGGRVENERGGLYTHFTLSPEGSDEGLAISSALSLAQGDPLEASKILVSSYAVAKQVLDEHQDDVAAVAAALVERDLTPSDLRSILRPLPPAREERNVPREPITVISGPALQCLEAMMDGHPFAMAWIFFFAPPRLVCLDMGGRLRGHQ